MAKTRSGKSVPVGQMLSQDQSSEFIELFLRKMFKNLKAPKEFVCDESKALLKALAATFAKCEGISCYVTQCMAALQTGSPRPLIHLRIDRSHFVKNVTNKIKDNDYRRRDFYRGVVGYLIQCDSFSNAKKIIQDFFTTILNKFDGFVDSNPLPAEDSKRKLLFLLESYDANADYAEDTEKLPDTELDVNVDCSWIENIIAEVVITDDVDQRAHDNLYFNPGVEKFYIKLFSTIPLWSNLMNSLFESSRTVATSADVESNFKSLKTGIIGRKMIRPDTFLLMHVDFVNAEVKLKAGSKKTEPSEVKIRNRSKSLSEISPTIQRKRSNSNQFEYHSPDPNGIENGKKYLITK